MDDDLSLGAAIRKARMGQELSRRRLAELSGVSERQIEYIEDDEKDPKVGTVNKLYAVLRDPRIMAAAHRGHVVVRPGALGDSAEQATARKRTHTVRGMGRRTSDLVLSASG